MATIIIKQNMNSYGDMCVCVSVCMCLTVQKIYWVPNQFTYRLHFSGVSGLYFGNPGGGLSSVFEDYQSH